MTTLHYSIPNPPLSLFVESFWLYQGTIPHHTKERRLPDGSISLIINLSDNRIRLYKQRCPDQFQDYCGTLISGTHSEFALLDTTCLTNVLGVQFKPGGAFPFLPIPACELHNQMLSLDMVWGTEVFDLYAQLQTADTPEGCFQLLEQFLLKRLAQPRIIHPVVTFVLKAFEEASYSSTISSVTEKIGLSQTRIFQLFRDTVGLSPKQFCRVLRFQHVLQSVEQNTPQSWVELALTCGYYDQAHFVHDFQAFSGLTPGAYLAQRGQHRNHVPFSL